LAAEPDIEPLAASSRPYSLSRLVFNWAIEIGSIIVFWLGFHQHGLMTGIAWSLTATVVVLVLGILVQRRLAWFPIAMSCSFLGFGGHSLATLSPVAFMFQHTLYYGVGGILLTVGLIQKKSFLKPLFDNLFAVTDKGWLILARRWTGMFYALAIGNEFVWRTLSESAWAHYKIGMTLSITAFGLYQLTVTRRERLPNASAWGLKIR
jgi:intracellular septation protein